MMICVVVIKFVVSQCVVRFYLYYNSCKFEFEFVIV